MGRRLCPNCGQSMDRLSRICADCKGYGRKRHLTLAGYVRVYVPGHPVANADGYALEHRYVMYEAGVELVDGTHVHHLNGDKSDNRLDNLEVIEEGEHHRQHIREVGYVVNQYGTWPLRCRP